MKFESITIKDIAKALDLSASTVSRALRDSYEISPETKRRVTTFAKEQNYIPNPIALSLKERKTMSIGVLVSEIANTFFSQAIDGVESVANTLGYNVVILQSKESAEREKMILNYISARSIDGLIISVSSETHDYGVLKDLQAKGLPIVFFDRVIEEIETHKVSLDNFKGAYDATEHLLQNGYKRIGVVANNRDLAITKSRVAGFKRALEDNNIALRESMIRYCPHGGLDVDEVDKEVNWLFKSKNRPDAIFTLTDKLTSETLRIAKRRNMKVPADFALIGFSNSKDTSLMDPPLSIIMQPALKMGEIAAHYLFDLIDSKKAVTNFENPVLLPDLIIRESTPPKKKVDVAVH